MAQIFPDAWGDFQKEVEQISAGRLSDLVFCSWGDYDRKQLMKDCQHHKIAYPFSKHTNLKKAFSKRFNIKPVGMAKALRILGMPLAGAHHRGIDDARNIAKLFRHEWKG